ncbi:DUF1772 domain-containing protein [Rhodotorula paludigena]|uniref:DUF1772 domain-containing protein n=1 Tax=Rhodotorula paludigena TaxID=86838 RepID=UPI00317F6954
MSASQLCTTLACSVTLATAGGIASLSYSSVPLLSSLAKRASVPDSLADLRALFSSGSHVFPQLASLAAAHFASSAYSSSAASAARTGYSLAAGLTASILPFTVAVMLPAVNAKLIELDERVNKKKDAAREPSQDEVVTLLRKFGAYNAVRAALIGAGGVVGVWTAVVA